MTDRHAEFLAGRGGNGLGAVDLGRVEIEVGVKIANLAHAC
jgi:hypothetical protein